MQEESGELVQNLVSTWLWITDLPVNFS